MSRKGFALIASVIIITLLSALGLFGVSMLSTDTHISVDAMHGDEAFYIAEAGMKHVMAKISNDSAFRASPTQVVENFGSGSFTVDVSKAGNTYTLTSTADIGDIHRVLTQSVVYSEAPEAFKYSFYTDNDIDIARSSFLTVNGDMAAAGAIDIEEWLIDGVNGTIEEYHEVPIVVVDYDYYQSIADTVVTGNQTFSGATYNGVWYVDGNVLIEKGADINGTVVATGDITIDTTTGVDIIADSGMPAFVNQGNFFITDSKTVVDINGLVYSEGSITLYNNTTINMTGAFISIGNILFDWITNINCDWDPDLLLGLPGFSIEAGESAMSIITPQKDWDEQ